MKRIITLLAIVCLYSTLAFSQKKYELVIEKTDGTEITVNSEDIVRTYFRVNGSNKTDYELAVEKKDGTEVAVHTALIVKTYYRERQDNNLCPDANHPHMIDLGLPSGTKWACCNVGASKPEDYGGYYAWGETQTKSVYDWSNYKYCDGEIYTCHDIGVNISGTSYDAATVNWGAPWCMPTATQCEELCNNSTLEYTTINGVYGCVVIGPNGGTMFLPAAGGMYDNGPYGVGKSGQYWSSERWEGDKEAARIFSFYDEVSRLQMNNIFRNGGLSIRPVR